MYLTVLLLEKAGVLPDGLSIIIIELFYKKHPMSILKSVFCKDDIHQVNIRLSHNSLSITGYLAVNLDY